MPRKKFYLPSSSVVLFCLDGIFIAAFQSLFFINYFIQVHLYSFRQAISIVFIDIILQLVFLYAVGCYRRDTVLDQSASLSQVPVAASLNGVILFLTIHLAYAAAFPRVGFYRHGGECAIIVLVVTGVSVGACILSRLVFAIMLRQHWFGRRVLVIGTGKKAEYLKTVLPGSHTHLTIKLIFVDAGLFLRTLEPGDLSGEHRKRTDATVDDGELVDRLIAEGVDEIVVAADDRRGLSLNRLLEFKASGIPVTNYETFIERETGRIDLRWVEDSWLVYSEGFKMRPIDTLLKRGLDIFTAVVILTVTSPVLLISMAAIFLETGLPIFYRQERITKAGRRFNLFKLRSMRIDAEKDGPRWAGKQDNRVTKVGAFIRKTRIDELPQLFNILRGDMSLVGPRPERPIFTQELAKTIRLYDLRHSVAAGLTGWAQINYPYGASVEDAYRKLEYDLYYIKNYHVLRDILILLQTLRIVLWMSGAR